MNVLSSTFQGAYFVIAVVDITPPEIEHRNLWQSAFGVMVSDSVRYKARYLVLGRWGSFYSCLGLSRVFVFSPIDEVFRSTRIVPITTRGSTVQGVMSFPSTVEVRGILASVELGKTSNAAISSASSSPGRGSDSTQIHRNHSVIIQRGTLNELMGLLFRGVGGAPWKEERLSCRLFGFWKLWNTPPLKPRLDCWGPFPWFL